MTTLAATTNLPGTLSALAADSAEPEYNGTPAWLAEVRGSSLARFRELGLPTRRHEEWRFTDIRPLAETTFAQPAERPEGIDAAMLDRLAIPAGNTARLVLVNGHYAPELSDVSGLGEGVEVLPLAEAVESRRELVEPLLADRAGDEDDAFEALNRAMLQAGVFVHAARNARAARPIAVVHLTVPGDQPVAVHARCLIVAEQGAQVEVIEDRVAAADGVYFTNAFTQIEAADNAVVDHYDVQRESTEAFHVSTLRMRQGRDATVRSHRIVLGGSIVRNNVNPILEGENGHGLLNGLFLGRAGQHLDNHMRVEHRSPNCESRQYYRGILADESSGVFTGRILVVQEAQKTDAIQSNDNLVLTPTAKIYTKPQLEIYADDVRCTHGATIGQLDNDALFYLMARGVPEAEARSMLLFAFALANLERITIPELREAIEAEIGRRLPVSQDTD